MDTSIFINSEEQRRHLDMIHSLARQFGTTEDSVSVLYEGELLKLSGSARIRNFLPILTARLVREILTVNSLQRPTRHRSQSAMGEKRQTAA